MEGHGYNGKGPIWWYPLDKMYDKSNRPSDEELEEMKHRLLSQLEA